MRGSGERLSALFSLGVVHEVCSIQNGGERPLAAPPMRPYIKDEAHYMLLGRAYRTKQAEQNT